MVENNKRVSQLLILINYMIFTPISLKTGERLKMDVKDFVLPRGRVATFYVTDTKTSKTYKAKTMSCGLPRCICDAKLYDQE